MESWRVGRGVSSSSSVSTAGSSIFQKSRCVLGDTDRDAAANSFSSYQLRPPYSIKLQHHLQARHPDVAADNHDYSGATTTSDHQEISIFDAQKYFNELNITNDHSAAQKVSGDQHRLSAVSRFSWAAGSTISAVDDDHDQDYTSTISTSSGGLINRNNYPRPRSFHVAAAAAAATPTASSEASWNSQSGLLSNPRPAATNFAFMTSFRSRSATHNPHHPPPHHHDHENRKNLRATPLSPRWFSFPRRPGCPCSSKKSIQVVAQETKSIANISSSSSSLRVRVGEMNNIGEILVLDKKPAPTTTSVVTATNLSYSLAAPHEDTDRHAWAQQRRLCPTAASALTTTNAAGFTFPILKFNEGGDTSASSAAMKFQAVKKNGLTINKDQGPITPDSSSLQVFGGQLSDHQQSSTFSVQKPSNSATSFTFPSSPKSRFNIINTNSNITNNEDDVGSDASSDLFEIESFSTSTTTTTQTVTQTVQTTSAAMPTYGAPSSMSYQNYYRTCSNRDSFSLDDENENSRRLGANSNSGVGMYSRRSLDRQEPMTPASSTDQCYYEPSEASIDWSVTTAEGFDRSDQHDHRDEIAELSETKMMSSKRRPNSSGNNIGLLSCRREKAVSVGPNPVRLMAAAAESECQGGRRHAAAAIGVGPRTPSPSLNSRMTHVGSRPALANKYKPPLAAGPHSHSSARMSIPFATS